MIKILTAAIILANAGNCIAENKNADKEEKKYDLSVKFEKGQEIASKHKTKIEGESSEEREWVKDGNKNPEKGGGGTIQQKIETEYTDVILEVSSRKSPIKITREYSKMINKTTYNGTSDDKEVPFEGKKYNIEIDEKTGKCTTGDSELDKDRYRSYTQPVDIVKYYLPDAKVAEKETWQMGEGKIKQILPINHPYNNHWPFSLISISSPANCVFDGFEEISGIKYAKVSFSFSGTLEWECLEPMAKDKEKGFFGMQSCNLPMKLKFSGTILIDIAKNKPYKYEISGTMGVKGTVIQDEPDGMEFHRIMESNASFEKSVEYQIIK